jgi:hypothetical protein
LAFGAFSDALFFGAAFFFGAFLAFAWLNY